MLVVDDIDAYYGPLQILFGVSCEIQSDEVVVILGRNGVGKTTTIRSITGLTPPRRGTVTFGGDDITGSAPHEIAAKGLRYVPQGRRLFPELTVLENLRMGLGTRDTDPEQLEMIYDLFPKLEERSQQHGETLSGGEQQMVAIGRALMGNPELLIMDEPVEGLMPALIPRIEDTIQELADQGYAILLVEQNVDFALNVSDRVYFMEGGQIKYESTPDELEDDAEPFDRYLNVERDGERPS